MRKRILNFVLIFSLAVTAFSANIFAKDSTETKAKINYQRALEIFRSSLESRIPGIVEGSIYNVVLLKKYYPNADYSNVIDELNKIAEDYPVASIRYKAHLATMYLTMSNGIEVEPRRNVYEHEYLFKQIADQLESKLLVSN